MRTILVVVLLAGGPMFSLAPHRAQQLRWLSGCWEQRDARATVEEVWTSPRGGMLFGVGRTITPKGSGDTTASFEIMRIYERDGKLVFAARPAGEALTEFTERELTQNAVVFANPSHDFPQFIRYRRQGTNELSARVDGKMEGKEMGFDSHFRRVVCP
jgi:uncharacterized protein DUF6265